LSNLLRMLYSLAGDYPARQPLLYAESFSPNTPEGACPECHGLGRVYDVTERSMVPDDRLTVRERAVAAWPTAWHGQNLREILMTLGHNVDTPWRDLPKKERDWILFTDEQPTVPVYSGFDVRGAVQESELRHKATAMQAEAIWRCRTLGRPGASQSCLLQLHLATHDDPERQAQNMQAAR
jgi:excinuclease ABC subunit A